MIERRKRKKKDDNQNQKEMERKEYFLSKNHDYKKR